MPTSIPAGSICRSGSAPQIYYAEGLDKLAANIEEVQPDDHGGGAAAVRGAAHADVNAIEKKGGLALTLLAHAGGRAQAL